MGRKNLCRALVYFEAYDREEHRRQTSTPTTSQSGRPPTGEQTRSGVPQALCWTIVARHKVIVRLPFFLVFQRSSLIKLDRGFGGSVKNRGEGEGSLFTSGVSCRTLFFAQFSFARWVVRGVLVCWQRMQALSVAAA